MQLDFNLIAEHLYSLCCMSSLWLCIIEMYLKLQMMRPYIISWWVNPFFFSFCLVLRSGKFNRPERREKAEGRSSPLQSRGGGALKLKEESSHTSWFYVMAGGSGVLFA